MTRALALALTMLACSPTPVPPPAPTGLATISADSMRATVEHLASDDFRGRETGTPDVDRAAQWLAEQLSQAGLQPAPGHEALLSDYTLYRYGYQPEGTRLALSAGGADVPARLGATWRPFPFSDPGVAEGSVVFAGYGITAPDLGWDDYEGLDVAGKIVLVLRHEPGEDDEDSPFDGKQSSTHASFMTKAKNAADHGALGFLLVTDPVHHDEADDLRVDGRLVLDKREDGPRGASEGPEFRAAQIDRATAQALVATGGHDLTELQRSVDAGTPPRDLALGEVRASLSVALRDTPQDVPSRNVVAVLPGTDRADEWVVVGAHYDHIGAFDGPGDTVFNGADDNASGTSGLLALARAFASRPQRPSRTMVFVGFSGEEKGLLGSKAWVEQVGTEQVRFMFNLDMIGRNPDKPIEVYGDGYGTGVGDLINASAQAAGLEDLQLAGDGYFGASDHDPFYQRDVPFLFFFTGTHDDYHQLGDHSDKLDYGRMERIVRTAYGVLEPIADGQATPAFVHHVGWLGVSLQGERIAAVEAGGRAAMAGLGEGDVVLHVHAVDADDTDPADTDGASPVMGRALMQVQPGTAVRLSVRQQGEAREVDVTRAKVGYLGIFPGGLSDEERQASGLLDDDGVKVNGMAEGGPAAKAGLKDGDIIVQIGGATVSRRTLGRVLQRIGAGETVPTRVYRDGEAVMIQLELGERPERR